MPISTDCDGSDTLMAGVSPALASTRAPDFELLRTRCPPSVAISAATWPSALSTPRVALPSSWCVNSIMLPPGLPTARLPWMSRVSSA